jgi:hypothetical protein
MKHLKYNLQQAIRLIAQIVVDKRLFNLPILFSIRMLTYKILFTVGKGCFIGEHVFFDREHQKQTGSLRICDNVTITRNVHIDYTGFVVIKNNVSIGNGVEILTHYRDLEERDKGNDVNIQTTLVIEEGAYIGTRTVILASCNRIGKNVRIGACSVVKHDIPDNVLVAGVPAKIIKEV